MLSPDYTGFWKVIYDWQTLIAGAAAVIGGLTAYVAGVIQARATQKAADAQIAAARKRDLQQGRCIAAAIIPALLQFRLHLDSTTGFISEEIPKTTRPDNITDDIVSIILGAQIEIPSLLTQHLVNLYLLGDEAGAAGARAVGLTLQYNDQVARFPELVRQRKDLNPWDLLPKLSAHLEVIKRDIAECNSIAHEPIHRELIGLW